jgi:hypothetical protein
LDAQTSWIPSILKRNRMIMFVNSGSYELCNFILNGILSSSDPNIYGL